MKIRGIEFDCWKELSYEIRNIKSRKCPLKRECLNDTIKKYDQCKWYEGIKETKDFDVLVKKLHLLKIYAVVEIKCNCLNSIKFIKEKD